MSEGQGKTNWLLWGGLAAGVAGLFFLSKKAHAAAGNDPNNPPPLADPNRTRADLLQAWKNWIVAYLDRNGYVLQPSYNNTTFQIADAQTGDISRLVQRNQAVTDNNLGFWWKVTEINTGKADLNDDATWQALQGMFQKWVAGVTPQFLAK